MSNSETGKSPREIAEEVANRFIDYRGVAVRPAGSISLRGFVIAVIEKALRDRDERAAKIAESHEGHGAWCASAAGDCQSLTVKAIASAIRGK